MRSYNVYISSKTSGDFILLATNVRDTFYLDDNLPSYARCYKISAVDRSGNESELSDEFCIDNCPYYELPNIFTPNSDKCNDKFSAYNNGENSGEGGTEGCITSEESKKKCARFVEKVICKIYNRWGKEVYSYESTGDVRSIYINWDGRDSNGRELSSGVYYYIADVTFDVVDTSKRVKKIKGWVHLLR